MILSLVPGAVLAQAQGSTSPSLTIPRDFAPPRQGGDTLAIPSGTTRTPVAGGAKVLVGDVEISDGFPDLALETGRQLAALRGHQIDAGAIFAVAAAIERAYADAGYILARVVVPPQKLKAGGTLRLAVIDGFIESLDGARIPPLVRDKALAYLAPLVGQRHLTRRELERRLLLAGDIPGLALRSALQPGQQSGAAILSLDGTHRPVGLDISADNGLSRAIGRFGTSVSPVLNSVFGLGEQIYGSASGRPSDDFAQVQSPRRIFAGGFLLPLGVDGLTLNLESVFSSTLPRVAAGQIQTDSQYTRFSARLLYALIRGRDENLNLRFSYEPTREEQRATDFNAILYQDRIRPLRFGFDYSRSFQSDTTVQLGGDLSRGIDGLGSRGPNDATFLRPISRADAREDFAKGELRLRVIQQLPANFTFEANLKGQRSFTGALYNSEQFSLGGPRAISSLDIGALTGDHGWLARGELQYNHALSGSYGSALLSPYLFLAQGQVWTSHASAAERKTTVAGAYGAGLRVYGSVADKLLRQTEIGIEIAHQLRELRSDPDSWRLNVSGSVRF
ncbi:ShlB/FhaC/HecB family hemolysin secretion/activation protein [Bosea sp. 685]|uniref:ShlB/FhaC/HecB family hemolysin secretion/activation protein n=1 Tax=Bosea sp. 685 TaxID=3080057 RepID=UPI0028935EFE|nr:ShlB/FhaC/HecB family hemolysin secretion/activation protein [Bosea sp. 685]WNJ89845.1 ShlB/FhaC/HecB family hemolysin secretion/activation protein [Bosea sp. 685]